MSKDTTATRTGICDKCGAKHTHLLRLEVIELSAPPNLAPFSCPKCGQTGTLAAPMGHQIVGVRTTLHASLLGR
jgi:hypothetical protein